MKVKDLIKKLETFDQELEVGRTGHYGEFHEMNESDIDIHRDWPFCGENEPIRRGQKNLWVEINVPDIGPEPD